MMHWGLSKPKVWWPVLKQRTRCVKAANVELIGYENVGSGLVTVMVKGDVGAVKAAVDSGVESAQRIGEVVTSLVIARPHNDINKIVIKTQGLKAGENANG